MDKKEKTRFLGEAGAIAKKHKKTNRPSLTLNLYKYYNAKPF